MIKQEGLTLPELLISLLLSSLILAALAQYYFSNKKQYITAQQALSQQYDVQLVSELLRNSIRQAGFTPCTGLNWLKFYDDNSHPATPIAVNYGVHHAVHIERMSEEFAVINQFVDASQLLVEHNEAFDAKQTVLIADCFHAETAIIASMRNRDKHHLVIRLKHPLHFDYFLPAYLGLWLQEEFFIQKNSNGQAALFYKLNHAEELTPYINSFSAQLLSNQNQLLVNLTLGLANNQTIELKTAPRIP